MGRLLYIYIIAGALGMVWYAAAAPCLETNKPWGDPNPNIFWFCNITSLTAIQMECPLGSGFIRDDDYLGCVPYAYWPKSCVKLNALSPNCTSCNLLKPEPATNPSYFYVCYEDGTDALIGQCEEGKGFAKACGFDGCVDWPQWRNLTECVTY